MTDQEAFLVNTHHEEGKEITVIRPNLKSDALHWNCKKELRLIDEKDIQLLRDALQRQIQTEQKKHLVLDVQDISLMNSAAFSHLKDAEKSLAKKGGTFAVANVHNEDLAKALAHFDIKTTTLPQVWVEEFIKTAKHRHPE